MMKAMRWLYALIERHASILRRAMIFGLVGVLNVIVDFTIYTALTRSSVFWAEHYLVANTFAYAVAVTVSFTVNRAWTFRDRNQTHELHVQYLRFWLVSLTSYAWTTFFLWLLVDVLQLYDLLAKCLIVIIVYFWNFSCHTLWTFRPPRYAQSQ